MSGCKIIRVKNLLGDLLHMPGGISRSEAVEEAQRLIEELRADFERAIPDEITALEDLAALVGGSVNEAQLTMLIDASDPLLTLTGTFGTPALDAVVKRFCDLCAGMRDKGITAMAPIQVHLRAMRLVWNMRTDEAASGAVLSELGRIHAYYGIQQRTPQALDDLESALERVTA